MLKFVCFVLLATGACAILPNVASDERIIGGQFAAKGQFPYQVALRNNAGGLECGAAIVGPRFILTSGNCVQYSTVQNISAFVGAHTLTDGTRHELDRITKHPKFNWRQRANDVAVLRTAKPIEFNDAVQPIALPTTAVEHGREVSVAGWGIIYNIPGSNPQTLKWTDVTTISLAACRTASPEYSRFLTANTLCTSTEYGTGACTGDIGGALVTKSTPRVLVGISSWTSTICAFTRPDVYADVFQQLSFIRSAMQ